MKQSAHPHLIVVLHGDAPGANPSYQYILAQRAYTTSYCAALFSTVITRPGITRRIPNSDGSPRLIT